MKSGGAHRTSKLTCMHLDEDAAEGPHVDGQIVGNAEENLRTPVKPLIYKLLLLLKKMGKVSSAS